MKFNNVVVAERVGTYGTNVVFNKPIIEPTPKTVNWNPNEYKVIKIDTENGVIEFEKV